MKCSILPLFFPITQQQFPVDWCNIRFRRQSFRADNRNTCRLCFDCNNTQTFKQRRENKHIHCLIDSVHIFSVTKKMYATRKSLFRHFAFHFFL